MLSPGQIHLRIPKDPLRNIRWRQYVLKRAADSPRLQKAILEYCRQDIFFFINTFIFQYNPKDSGREVSPFICWDFQEQAVTETLERLFVDQRSILWEKSRELGATWLALIIILWMCLFHPWKAFLLMSHMEEAVDKPGSKSTLFWKLDFMLKYIPDWMKGKIKRSKLSFVFRRTNCTIDGAATTERSGVGGRYTAILLDEFSKHRQAAEILGQTADTGPRLFIGTHYGVGTTFFDLTQRPDMRKVIMHWSQHPKKGRGLYRYNARLNKIQFWDNKAQKWSDHTDYQFPPNYPFATDGRPTGGPFPGIRSPWYDAEVAERANQRDVAMHLDIDPRGSVSQFADAILIRNLVATYARSPYWEGELFFEEDTGKPIRLVERVGGPLKLWLQLQSDKPPPGRYVFGADVSTGEGATPSCASGGHWPSGEKIMEYSFAHIDPAMFGAMMVALCRLFVSVEGEPGRLVWEFPGPGMTFGKKVMELGFGNIYYRPVNPLAAGGDRSSSPGWHSSPQTKPVLLRSYLEALHTRQFLNRSESALVEFLNFHYTKTGGIEHGAESSAVGDPSGARSNHGDLVIADALCWLLMKEFGKTGKKAVEKTLRPGTMAWRLEQHDAEKRAASSWFAGV